MRQMRKLRGRSGMHHGEQGAYNTHGQKHGDSSPFRRSLLQRLQMRDLHFLDGGCGGVLLVDLALWLKRVGEVWQITLEDPLKHKGWQRPFEFWEVADVTRRSEWL